MGKTISERITSKMARLLSKIAQQEARERGRNIARAKKRAARYQRQRRRRAKVSKAEIKRVLAVARQVLGYRKFGPRKMTTKHLKALAEGRRRYWQAKRQFCERRES
jgi:hypothetical protein